MSRIYNALSVIHAGEKMTVEAFTKHLNDGTIKTNIVRKPDDVHLRCRKFWVGFLLIDQDVEDHVCTTVCQIYISMLDCLDSDPEVLYTRFEEIQKSLKPQNLDKLD